jgi:uncharacterized membrane protein YphA (DoxX/SURF4 family)
LPIRDRERGWVCTPVALTLLLRLVPGYLFLTAGISKIQSAWLGGGGLRSTLEGFLSSGQPFDWYRSFLQETVIPNETTFAYLLVIGEVAVGGLLLIGFLVRPASFVGIFLCLNYLCAKGSALVGFNVESLFLVILATCLLVNPGRSLGVDGFLYERLRLPTWII